VAGAALPFLIPQSQPMYRLGWSPRRGVWVVPGFCTHAVKAPHHHRAAVRPPPPCLQLGRTHACPAMRPRPRPAPCPPLGPTMLPASATPPSPQLVPHTRGASPHPLCPPGKVTPGDPCSRPGSPCAVNLVSPCMHVMTTPPPSPTPTPPLPSTIHAAAGSAPLGTCLVTVCCPHPHLFVLQSLPSWLRGSMPSPSAPPPSPSHNEGRAVVARHDVAPVPSPSPPPTHKRMAFDLLPNTASAAWCTLHKYTHPVA
jgi:hypothetical protein